MCHCDNQAVVADLKSRSSRHRGMMHLLRCVVSVEATFGCIVSLVYIDTKLNHLADDLSRNNVVSFLSKVPSCPIKRKKNITFPTWSYASRSLVIAGIQEQ